MNFPFFFASCLHSEVPHLAQNLVEVYVQVPQVIQQMPRHQGIIKACQIGAQVLHVIMNTPHVRFQKQQVIDNFTQGCPPGLSPRLATEG